jgi:hypothetical protein
MSAAADGTQEERCTQLEWIMNDVAVEPGGSKHRASLEIQTLVVKKIPEKTIVLRIIQASTELENKYVP